MPLEYAKKVYHNGFTKGNSIYAFGDLYDAPYEIDGQTTVRFAIDIHKFNKNTRSNR